MGQVTALLSAIAQGEREALGKLYALLYPELRYFAGMTASETADVLGLAVRTVARGWEKARPFLHVCLR